MWKTVLMILTMLLSAGVLISYPVTGTPAMQELEFETLTIKDGLSLNDVTDIFQDSRGFMWFTTNGGLNRYDGVTFKILRKNDMDPSSISFDIQNCITEDRDGALWIGTHGGGLNKYDPGTGGFTHFSFQPDKADSLCGNFVTAICSDNTGMLWVGTQAGLNRVNPETGKIRRFQNSREKPGQYLSDNYITQMCTAPDGAVWIATKNGLNRLEPAELSFTHYVNRPGDSNSLFSNQLTTLCVDSGGIVWAGSLKGLDRFDPAAATFTHFSASPDLANGLTSNKVTAILRDGGGLVWIGTADKGINVLDPETNTFYNFLPVKYRGKQSKHPHITKIHEDRSGLLWFSVWQKGLYKADRNKIKFPHIDSDPVFSIYEDEDGMVWLGNHLGKLIKYNRETGEKTAFVCTVKGKSSGCLGAIAGEPPDTLWIGTQYNGLLKFSNGGQTWKRFLPAPQGHYGNQVTSVMRGRDGIIWLGGRKGSFYSFNPQSGSFNSLPLPPGSGMPNGSTLILTIIEDRTGNIWLGGTQCGLFKYEPDINRFSHYKAMPDNPRSLNDNDVFAIYEDGTGKLWIATSGGGLNCLDPVSGLFSHYTSKQGLPSDNIMGILEDEKGILWLSTDRGISRFNPGAGEFKNYGLRAGIQGLAYNAGASFKNKKGEMFFGGVNGINIFQPANFKENTHQPPMAFTRFKRFNKEESIDFRENLTLSYKDNIFSFEFAALDYVNPSKNQYKYKVEGLHDDYIYLGHVNQVTLTGLNPGAYTLRVKGSNNDGIWSEESAVISIRITPPFWRTWWFRSLWLMLIAAVIYFAYRFRVNRLTARLQKEVILQKLYNKYGLSSREQEIIPYILDGQSNKEIEDKLFISLATVKSHIYNIYKKMGVKSRMELTAMIHKKIKGEG